MKNGLYIHTGLPPGFKMESFTLPNHPARTKFCVINMATDTEASDWFLKEQKAIEDFHSCRKAN